MFVLGLLTCITLRAFSAQARVVTSFEFNECSKFFYDRKPPEGMDQNAKKICQKLENNFYYATLYSVSHRIPLYSAYTLDSKCSLTTERKDIWHVEPQISDPLSKTDYMVREKDSDINTIKRNQAVSSDYTDSGYDRGHLNPNSFQYGQGRTATFTLTNAAPMDACFNRIHWNKWESTLRKLLLSKLVLDGGLATAYIVTGTVPSANIRIPQRENPVDSNRVTVPSHIWTAVCYKPNLPNKKSFSFAFMGQNEPNEHGVSLLSVSDLENELRKLLNPYRQVKIFNDCVLQEDEVEDEVNEAFYKLMNPSVIVVMNPAVEKKYNALKSVSSSNSAAKRKVKVTEVIAKLAFQSLSDYFYVTKDLKVFARSNCLIFNVRQSTTNVDGDLKKRDTSEGLYYIECQLFPEMQNNAADGSLCSSSSYSSYSCNVGDKIKPRCSSPCLYKDKFKGYRCYSDQKMIECSPPYSLITAKGERCLSDYPCATYGYDYYWCRTGHGYIKDDWDYCSPPLWRSKAENGKYCRSDRACAKYGDSQPWCYTNDGKKNKCCTSNDCHSAVNYKTCKSDHPCGNHGQKYLWCYTTDGKWDYCCSNCV